MDPQASPIPPFRADGYLPEALHLASEAEILSRFGSSTRRRDSWLFVSGAGWNWRGGLVDDGC